MEKSKLIVACAAAMIAAGFGITEDVHSMFQQNRYVDKRDEGPLQQRAETLGREAEELMKVIPQLRKEDAIQQKALVAKRFEQQAQAFGQLARQAQTLEQQAHAWGGEAQALKNQAKHVLVESVACALRSQAAYTLEKQAQVLAKQVQALMNPKPAMQRGRLKAAQVLGQQAQVFGQQVPALEKNTYALKDLRQALIQQADALVKQLTILETLASELKDHDKTAETLERQAQQLRMQAKSSSDLMPVQQGAQKIQQQMQILMGKDGVYEDEFALIDADVEDDEGGKHEEDKDGKNKVVPNAGADPDAIFEDSVSDTDSTADDNAESDSNCDGVSGVMDDADPKADENGKCQEGRNKAVDNTNNNVDADANTEDEGSMAKARQAMNDEIRLLRNMNIPAESNSAPLGKLNLENFDSEIRRMLAEFGINDGAAPSCSPSSSSSSSSSGSPSTSTSTGMDGNLLNIRGVLEGTMTDRIEVLMSIHNEAYQKVKNKEQEYLDLANTFARLGDPLCDAERESLLAYKSAVEKELADARKMFYVLNNVFIALQRNILAQ
ncbi:hypothetical protein FACS189449_12210 [Alphaproteobacteria bacterium]|nr:hypothetical protein FACS189449_12210 [Alphaproteobacteria bacterium]